MAMARLSASRAIKLCGTEQPDLVGRTLKAGALSAEFDSGNLRYVRLNGVEVLRAIAFLVRDENWGTYTPTISDLVIDQRDDAFSVSYRAVCSRPGQEIAYTASIEGNADGSLEFKGTAKPSTDFLTARTGFVVLHPLQGVAGQTLEVLHVDGTKVRDKFPELVNPDCPFRDIRALSHEALPGLWASVRMEGEAFEMEDHRNWTDASFKTYVRPLAKPWPYTIAAGEVVEQSVRLSFSGALPPAAAMPNTQPIEVAIGKAAKNNVPPIGLGIPAEEAQHALDQVELLKMLGPKFLVCHFDPRLNHGVVLLRQYRRLCTEIKADCALEIVVTSLDNYRGELQRIAGYVEDADLRLASVALCPVGHLKSVLPGGTYPPAPSLEDLYAAGREAFPRAKLGGGMFSFFTELNRKRPPAQLLDFVTNTTCPIVHAADDRSVMETLEALPWQIKSARSFIGAAAHRVGPSGLGCRDNPHGATYTFNPDNLRVCLAKMEPRQRAIFSAAWTLGYVATLAKSGVAAISMAAPTGPLGVIYRKTDYAQPYFDVLSAPAVYPVFHTLSGLTRGCGQKLVDAESSHPAKVQCLAYRDRNGTTLWIANLTADEQSVAIRGLASGEYTVGMLDEASFLKATSEPMNFRRSGTLVRDLSTLKLKAYAVMFVAA
jgi:D-apionolactonase